MKPSSVVKTLLLFIIYSLINTSRSQAQTFFGVSSNPADNGSYNNNTVTVTQPPGMSAGQLVILYAHYKGNNTLSISNTAATGQTWSTAASTSNTSQSTAIFWCEFNGTWGASPIISGGGSSEALTGVMYVFNPSNASKIWGIHIATTNGSDGTSPFTISGLTTTVPNTVTMAFWGSQDDNTWGNLTGTAGGWSKTGLANQYRNQGGTDQSHTSAYNIQAAAAVLPNVAQDQLTLGDDNTRTSIISWAEFTPPSNDLCTNATPLTASATVCTPVNGSVIAANYTAFTGACTTNPDVWYSFTASAISDTIRISGLTNGYVQLMTAASCGGTLSQIGSCSNASGTNGAIFTGLTVGAQYLIRVYSNSGASSDFTICIKDIAPATLDYGKSYANISKLSGGGTIAVGDTLEIRATLVVRTFAIDSISFIDTLPKGVHFVPGSIATKTNEGKIYRWDNTSAAAPVAFTDNFDSDGGYVYTSAGDSIIRINMGTGSTSTARGKIRQTSAPRIGSGTSANSIIMATYRVVVDTTFGAILNLGGGYFTARDSATTTLRQLSFGPRSAVVYQTPGLCPNALSPSNAIADEYGGTFGNAVLSPSTSRVLKDRAASSNVPGYTYAPFAASAPNDYYYGVSNNTGAGGANYTAVNTWPKNSNRRVHQVWDITGDHTGASNLSAGNPACDTTLPRSASNPCGYMLVVNSAYKTDTAFQYNISNLCPNTYFEISFWVKNICAKCGADSLGRWASSTGYLPTATNDSSGVQPNLAIDINGIDYYTTGQIQYPNTGIAQSLQDNANVWVKRGFTYLTGSTPGTLTMSIRNTAPGGGGNDWALDDINVATCFPNMSYSPSLTPNVCIANPLTIYDTVRSYFNNYNYYKWQRSTNGGGSWTDVTSAFGPVTPTLNGSLYEYISSYTIPPANATLANGGDLYRLITATTNSNLSSSDCISTDFSSIVTLNVIDCNPVLKTTLLSFSGKLVNSKASLSWITSKEDEQITYIIERSSNQTIFNEVGRVNGFNNNTSEKNYYSFLDPSEITQKTWYRIVMVNPDGKKQYSRIILIDNSHPDFGFGNVINPFNNNLYFDITSKESSKIEVTLIDMSGKPVIRKNFLISSGVNSLSIDNTSAIAQGVYTLKIENKGNVITKRVIKRN